MGVMTVIPATIRPANTSREETKDNIQKIKVALPRINGYR